MTFGESAIPNRNNPVASRHQAERLLVVDSVRGIIAGLYFREPFQAGGVDLCDSVLEGGAFDLIFPRDTGDYLPG